MIYGEKGTITWLRHSNLLLFSTTTFGLSPRFVWISLLFENVTPLRNQHISNTHRGIVLCLDSCQTESSSAIRSINDYLVYQFKDNYILSAFYKKLLASEVFTSFHALKGTLLIFGKTYPRGINLCLAAILSMFHVPVLKFKIS